MEPSARWHLEHTARTVLAFCPGLTAHLTRASQKSGADGAAPVGHAPELVLRVAQRPRGYLRGTRQCPIKAIQSARFRYSTKTYKAESNTYTCPAGKVLPYRTTQQDRVGEATPFTAPGRPTAGIVPCARAVNRGDRDDGSCARRMSPRWRPTWPKCRPRRRRPLIADAAPSPNSAISG